MSYGDAPCAYRCEPGHRSTLVRLSISFFSRRSPALVALSLFAACSDMASPRAIRDPQSADVAFCGTPAWVAFQDDGGAWTHAMPTQIGLVASFHHTFTTNRAGLAVARELANGMTSLSILYAAPEELSMVVNDTAGIACGATSFKTLRGTVLG